MTKHFIMKTPHFFYTISYKSAKVNITRSSKELFLLVYNNFFDIFWYNANPGMVSAEIS